jgi:hypothetical protein
MAGAAVLIASLALAAPSRSQGLAIPFGGGSDSPSAAPAQPYRPAVSPFRAETLSEQWSGSTNPLPGRNTSGACKDAATRQAEQSPSPPTPVTCQ